VAGKLDTASVDCLDISAFQSFFFWMWLENEVDRDYVVGKQPPFQSFFFWMWLENSVWAYWMGCRCRCFNPSSSGCGWKTCAAARLCVDIKPNPVFQSFFFWMWLENKPSRRGC